MILVSSDYLDFMTLTPYTMSQCNENKPIYNRQGMYIETAKNPH